MKTFIESDYTPLLSVFLGFFLAAGLWTRMLALPWTDTGPVAARILLPLNCDFNFCTGSTFGGLPAAWILITGLVLAMGLAALFSRILRMRPGALQPVLIICITLLTAIEISVQWKALGPLTQLAHSAERRREAMFGDLYVFSREVSARFPGQAYSARLISDLNLREADGMFVEMALNYFLYPIDIRLRTDDDPGMLIVYRTGDPHGRVPEDFHVVYQHSPTALVAVRKD